MTDRIFHNHFTILLDNLMTYTILVLLIAGGMYDNVGPTITLAVCVALLSFLVVITFFIWRRTTVTFTDSEIITSRNTAIIKSEKRIQYSRLASIGVKKGIFDKLVGTTRLQFNVNSSVNAFTPEATLTLRDDLATAIRDELNSKVFSKETTIRDEEQMESLVHVSNAEIIIHSFLSQSTNQLLFAILMTAYSVVSLFTGSNSGLALAIILLILNEAIPFVKNVVKYYNYRLYRVGDTITIQSGLFTTQRSSFRICKVNSIRMRQPLLARVAGLSTLEAEVIGLATSEDSDSSCPLLCPLKKKAVVEDLMGSLFPEAVFEPQEIHQTRGALIAMAIADAVYTAVIVAVFAFLLIFAEVYLADVSDTWRGIVTFSEVAAMIVLPLLLFGHCGLAQKHRTFALGSESFMIVYGAYDISEEYILYDKVQHTDIVAGPIERFFGVARCKVSMMSSLGFKSLESGLFPPDALKSVPDEVMARIRDGRYDHRKYI